MCVYVCACECLGFFLPFIVPSLSSCANLVPVCACADPVLTLGVVDGGVPVVGRPQEI